MRRHSDAIKGIIETVYKTGYSWIEEVLQRKFGESESTCASALYKFIRTSFRAENRDDMANYVWFGFYGSDYGYYLHDRDASIAIVEIMKPRKFRSGKSPANHLLNLLATSLRYEQSIFRYVVQQGDVLDFPLLRAPYASNQPDYVKTEEQMVSQGSISLFPIVADSKINLGIGFPTQYKKDILPIIRTNKNELAKIWYSERKSVHKYALLMRKHFAHLDLESLGNFVGGVTGGLIKSLSQP